MKKLPIQNLIIPILMNYKSIYNIKDFISLMPENCLKDVSDSEQVKKMNEMYSNIENHYNKFFHFKESEKVIGELNIDFFEGQLVNVRIKLYFNELGYKNDYLKNVKMLIEELVAIDLNSGEMSLGYYDYSGTTKGNWIIGLKDLSDSISIAISDGNIKAVFYDE